MNDFMDLLEKALKAQGSNLEVVKVDDESTRKKAEVHENLMPPCSPEKLALMALQEARHPRAKGMFVSVVYGPEEEGEKEELWHDSVGISKIDVMWGLVRQIGIVMGWDKDYE